MIRRGLLHVAEMRAAMPAVDPGRQHEPVQLHDPPDALAVVAGAKGPIHHRPDPAVAIGGPAVGYRVDLLEDHRIVGPLIAARRALPADVVPRPPPNPERVTDHRHRPPRHRPDPLPNHGLFFRTSRAASRISISICLRPSRRSSSRMRP